MKAKSLLAVLAVGMALSAMADTTRADEIFTVTLNTAPLTTAADSAAGPFSLAFQLAQGDPSNPLNTATVSDFAFGGGSAAACPANCTTFGGVTGDATSSIGLSTSDGFEAIIQAFTPGSQLSFQVDVSTNINTGVAPDDFAFSLLDSTGFPIPTQDGSGADTFLTVLLNSSSPSVLTYASDPTTGTAAGDVLISLSAPAIGTPTAPASTPEPSSLVLLACTVAALLGAAICTPSSHCRFRE
jgi:hypothetical protein